MAIVGVFTDNPVQTLNILDKRIEAKSNRQITWQKEIITKC